MTLIERLHRLLFAHLFLPGHSVEYALKFWLAAGGPRTRDAALDSHSIPVVTSVPCK